MARMGKVYVSTSKACHFHLYQGGKNDARTSGIAFSAKRKSFQEGYWNFEAFDILQVVVVMGLS